MRGGKRSAKVAVRKNPENWDLNESFLDFSWDDEPRLRDGFRSASEVHPSPLEWDLAYREGTPPWETGRPAAELVRLVQQGKIPKGTAIDIGCGTGANAVYLAQEGFEVTAVDISPTAIERARTRAAFAGVNIHFVVDDVFQFIRSCPAPFDFLLDAGFYHYVRAHALSAYLDFLWRASRPGSYCLVLAGHAAETAEGAPPGVTEEELRFELGRLFEFVEMRPFRFESLFHREGYLGWSCLLYRPILPTFRR